MQIFQDSKPVLACQKVHASSRDVYYILATVRGDARAQGRGDADAEKGPNLELFEYVVLPEETRPPARPCDIGTNHFALNCSDIDACVARWVKAGGKSLGIMDLAPSCDGGDGNRFAYCRTPWDSTVEFTT